MKINHMLKYGTEKPRDKGSVENFRIKNTLKFDYVKLSMTVWRRPAIKICDEFFILFWYFFKTFPESTLEQFTHF